MDILVQRYYHHDSRQLGNEIVRQFIIDRQLIVTGGLVVNFALKLKGEPGIYADYEVPDYDFFSSDNAKDASDLFRILYDKGFRNISLLPGIHPSTIKVYVYKDCIADITYITREIFDMLSGTALVYDGMKFRHPHLQYPDMHRALSYPYENEPRETINNRWVKDFERFTLLYKHYPCNFTRESITACTQRGSCAQLLSKYVIAGRTAINFYLNGCKSDSAVDAVYLMDQADYDVFLKANGKSISKMVAYKSYLELMPERTEMMFGGEKITILHCNNKTGIYYETGQTTAREESLAEARSRVLRRAGNTLINPSVKPVVLSPTGVNKNKCYAGINFCVIYCFSMLYITGDEWYHNAYGALLQLLYESYTAGNEQYYPSIITYGVEVEKPIIVYTSANPDAKVPQVHIKDTDSEEVQQAQLAKLPYDFAYLPEIYDLDGKQKN